MDKMHILKMWIGGKFAEPSKNKLCYNGGRMYSYPRVNMDYLSEQNLYDFYKHFGGHGHNVEFYYVTPGEAMEHGLKRLNGSWSMIEMQMDHEDKDEFVVYSLKKPGPLAALDKDGNDITEKIKQIEEGVYEIKQLTYDTPMEEPVITQETLHTPVEEPVIAQVEKPIINEATQNSQCSEPRQQEVEFDFSFEDIFNDEAAHDEAANETVGGEATIDEATVDDAGVGEAVDDTPITEEAADDAPILEEAADDALILEEAADDAPILEEAADVIMKTKKINSKGKRKMMEDDNPDESPDDSDDASYTEEDSSYDMESDTPSEAYDDIEGSEDDDIFQVRERTTQSKRQMWAEMRRKNKRKKKSKSKEDVREVRDEGWYSDADMDGNFDEPPISDNEGPRHPVYKKGDDIKKIKLQVGLKFDGVGLYKEVLTDWSVRHDFVLDFLKSEARRVTAVCAAEGCTWRIHASTIQNSEIFQVKTLKGEHTCARESHNYRARADYIAKRMENTIRDNVDMPIDRLIRMVSRKVGVDITYWVALRAKKIAIDKIRGDAEKEYTLLWNYCETVRARNPGSKILLRKKEDSNPPVFDSMYLCLAAMKDGFMAGCRPLIGLDGCFVKTIHGGQLLSAIGRDANDNLFPIAIAYVRSECRDTWVWFLTELLEDISGLHEDRWTFISDRQKGLLDAVKEVAPQSEHRYCLRHLYQNFQGKWKSQEMKQLFWKAASVGNKDEHFSVMKDIERLDPTAALWLMDIPEAQRARSFFKTTSKSDILVNNLCESFNNMILPARDLPIISMFEWIRGRLMTRIQIKKEGMEKYEGHISPNVLKKLNKQLELTRYCVCKWSGRLEFEVEEGDDTFVVNLEKRTCTCGMFQLNGYPCSHACSAIGDRRHKVENYVDECYYRDTYLKTYQFMIHPVPGKKHYIQTPYEPLAPPEFKKKMGRPKKCRRKSVGEVENLGTRKGLTHTCANCLQEGHNKKSCKNPTNPNSKYFKKVSRPAASASRPIASASNQPVSASRPPASASRPTPPAAVARPIPPASASRPITPAAASSSPIPAATTPRPSPPIAAPSHPIGPKKQRLKKPSLNQVLNNIRSAAKEKRMPKPWIP